MCPDCIYPSFRSKAWKEMREHYSKEHPEEKRPDKLFTREAREKNP